MIKGSEIKRARDAAGSDALQPLNVNSFTGETIVHVPESEIVKTAREERWGGM
jgi:hypothetical protein